LDFQARMVNQVKEDQ
jgi:hypothetical protein